MVFGSLSLCILALVLRITPCTFGHSHGADDWADQSPCPGLFWRLIPLDPAVPHMASHQDCVYEPLRFLPSAHHFHLCRPLCPSSPSLPSASVLGACKRCSRLCSLLLILQPPPCQALPSASLHTAFSVCGLPPELPHLAPFRQNPRTHLLRGCREISSMCLRHGSPRLAAWGLGLRVGGGGPAGAPQPLHCPPHTLPALCWCPQPSHLHGVKKEDLSPFSVHPECQI